MKRFVLALFVTAMVFVPSVARAGVRNHRAAHVSFWVPDNWSATGDEATQLQIADPKGEVSLLFLLQDHHDMKSAANAIDALINKLATDVKASAPKQVTVNGMDGTVVDATGRAMGKRVELSVLVLKTPGDRYLMVFGVLESDHKRAHQDELEKIIGSLKPVR
jgi:hypothetical protein